MVDHPSPDVVVVASGFGAKAQWFRNIAVHPQVRVWLGSHRPVAGVAHILDQRAADQVLTGYRERHPATWEQFKLVLEQTLGQPITETDTRCRWSRSGCSRISDPQTYCARCAPPSSSLGSPGGVSNDVCGGLALSGGVVARASASAFATA